MTMQPGRTAGVAVGPDGRAVVVKTGFGPRAARLRHEAAVLAAAAHPGVVEVLALADGADGGVRLTTAFAGVAATAPAPDPAAAARLLAGVTATLADLHDRGVVHGRVTPDHVLLGPSGAVLCGFGESSLPGAGGTPAPGDDVVAVADLADRLLGDERDGVAGSVRSVLERVRPQDPGARPTMRALASALAQIGATAPAGRRLLPAHRGPIGSARRRRVMVVLGLAGGLLAGGLALALVPDRPAADRPARVTRPTGTTTPPRPPADEEPVAGPPSCPPVVGADVDGDGCDEAVAVAGATLAWAGTRWSVGRPGDVAAVGDWDCDGAASPAVLRPEDGSVWVYRAWGEGEAAVPAGEVPGAVALRAADPDADGCDALLLQRRDGTTTVVEPPADRPTAAGSPPRWPAGGPDG